MVPSHISAAAAGGMWHGIKAHQSMAIMRNRRRNGGGGRPLAATSILAVAAKRHHGMKA